MLSFSWTVQTCPYGVSVVSSTRSSYKKTRSERKYSITCMTKTIFAFFLIISSNLRVISSHQLKFSSEGLPSSLLFYSIILYHKIVPYRNGNTLMFYRMQNLKTLKMCWFFGDHLYRMDYMYFVDCFNNTYILKLVLVISLAESSAKRCRHQYLLFANWWQVTLFPFQ